ncbi:uncharacterized protein C1orf141 homolog [Thomomys bottae]
MAEKVLKMLEDFNKQELLLLKNRAKHNKLEGIRAMLVTPLTTDFHLEYEEDMMVNTPKAAVAGTSEDKPRDTKKPQKPVSSKYKSEHRSNFEKPNLKSYFISKNTKHQEKKLIDPVEENSRPRYNTKHLYFLKDTTEAENAQPFIFKYSEYNQRWKRQANYNIISPVVSSQSTAYTNGKESTSFSDDSDSKKSLNSADFKDSVNERRTFPLPMNNSKIGEKTIRNRPLHKYGSVRKKTLIPLCMEDELKNPNAKIIDLSTAKRGTTHSEQSETHPITFHDSRYIKKLLLTKNRFSPHLKEREHFYQYRTNFVLERNCAILKSLISDPSATVSKSQSSMSRAQGKAIKSLACELAHRALRDKTMMQISSKTTTIKPLNKRHTSSQAFSNLTKKFVDYFDKTIIHEGSERTGKMEELASTTRPVSTPKIYDSSIKCYPKHVKNVLAVHQINNISPLDDLVTSPKKT